MYLVYQTRCANAQVIVATAPMAWGMTAAAQLVVVMGTQARPRLGTLQSTGCYGCCSYTEAVLQK